MTKEDTIEQKLKGAMALGINKYSVEDLCQIIKQHYLGKLPKELDHTSTWGLINGLDSDQTNGYNKALADVRKVIGGNDD